MLLFPAKVITDRISEKSKGYGFVTFASQDEAEKAITEMNEKVTVEFITLLLFLVLEVRTKISLCRH
jgi:RNA recognition motif-containing protein